MYYLSPFHYLLEGMLGLVVHNQPVTCESVELAVFAAPPGQTCDSYAGAYASQAGGYVMTQADGMCGYCQYATGDAFVSIQLLLGTNLTHN
jgi:ATP-binding cassette subfamily G (WHITE) protein 2 (SNQ2)